MNPIPSKMKGLSPRPRTPVLSLGVGGLFCQSQCSVFPSIVTCRDRSLEWDSMAIGPKSHSIWQHTGIQPWPSSRIPRLPVPSGERKRNNRQVQNPWLCTKDTPAFSESPYSGGGGTLLLAFCWAGVLPPLWTCGVLSLALLLQHGEQLPGSANSKQHLTEITDIYLGVGCFVFFSIRD